MFLSQNSKAFQLAMCLLLPDLSLLLGLAVQGEAHPSIPCQLPCVRVRHWEALAEDEWQGKEGILVSSGVALSFPHNFSANEE
jgi:hypothetical protein